MKEKENKWDFLIGGAGPIIILFGGFFLFLIYCIILEILGMGIASH